MGGRGVRLIQAIYAQAEGIYVCMDLQGRHNRAFDPGRCVTWTDQDVHITDESPSHGVSVKVEERETVIASLREQIKEFGGGAPQLRVTRAEVAAPNREE
jgi:hypothetical protein